MLSCVHFVKLQQFNKTQCELHSAEVQEYTESLTVFSYYQLLTVYRYWLDYWIQSSRVFNDCSNLMFSNNWEYKGQ